MNIEPGFSQRPAGLAEPAGHDVSPARSRLRWIIGAAVVALLLAGIILWSRGGEGGPQPAEQTLPRVTVVVPGRQPVPSVVSATGSLAARREMPVGIAGEGGLVSRVQVEPGDWVGAGQTLAVIERSVQIQENASLAASVNVAQADAALAQAELDRAQSLVGRGFISKADIDRRTATRDSARARVRVAQAQVAESRARIGRLDVRAPAAGLVLTRSVEPGQIVGPSTGALFRVAKGGEMEMLARLAEQDLARLRVGTPVQVTPTGSPRSFAGKIWQLSPIIDATSRQGTVRVALAYDPALRPGGFATAEITSGMVDAPLLPESAVQSDEKGNYVYVVTSDNRVQRRAVTTGDVSDRGIVVTKGLSGNEAVVLSAGAFLNTGDKVIPERRAARP